VKFHSETQECVRFHSGTKGDVKFHSETKEYVKFHSENKDTVRFRCGTNMCVYRKRISNAGLGPSYISRITHEGNSPVASFTHTSRICMSAVQWG
jgi:hypothetical protein